VSDERLIPLFNPDAVAHQIMEALGIDPYGVMSINLRFNREACVVAVERFVGTDQAKEAVKVLEEFYLAPRLPRPE